MDKEQFKLFMEQQQKNVEEMLRIQRGQIQELLRIDVKPTLSSFVPTFREFDRSKENFGDYVAQMEQHFSGNNVTDEEKKRSLFLSWVGTATFNDLRKLYNDGDKYKTEEFTVIVDKLKTFFRSKMHVLAARCKFLHLKMNPNESYSEWIGRLREASRKCEFECKNNGCTESYVDWAIRDMIVMHTHHEAVRTSCLQKSNPTLEEVTGIASSYESTQSSIQIMTGENSTSVHEVKVLNDRSNRSRSRYRFNRCKQQPSRQHSGSRSNSKPLRSCPGCGTKHRRQNCRFLHEQCHGCGQVGHIKSVCMSVRNHQPIRSKSRQLMDKDKKEFINSLEVYQLNESDDICGANKAVYESIQVSSDSTRKRAIRMRDIGSCY